METSELAASQVVVLPRPPPPTPSHSEVLVATKACLAPEITQKTTCGNKCQKIVDPKGANGTPKELDGRDKIMPVKNKNNEISPSNVPQQQPDKLAQQVGKQPVEHNSTAHTTLSHQQTITSTTTTNTNNNNNNNNNNSNSHLCQNVSSASLLLNCISSNNNNDESDGECQINARDFTLLSKETQELKVKTRKLQLEIDEKNEIINILRDELETTKEQNDKFQRENLQLLKDSKRVKFLQDENDFLQDKMGNVDKLELELKRLKEKLAETEFLKLRISELEEDKDKAQEESLQFEEKWQKAEQKLTRVIELETELNKWKLFSHELELERNSIQSRLLESIEQEAKLNSTNKQVEDEVKRLRSLIKYYEEQRDEEQASNSLIMSVADLEKLDQQQQQQQDHSDILETTTNADTSIKFEIDQQLDKELNEENRNLKQKLSDQEFELNRLIETNREVRNELENNKSLISDLRQDLACEKSLASKLTKQLAAFTRQIKNLDKQYFPIHDQSAQQSPPTTTKTTVLSSPLTKATTETNEAITSSPLIRQEETVDRKLHESTGNRINSTKHEEKESSPWKSVASFEYLRQQKSLDTVSSESLCDKKKPNLLQGNDNNCDDTTTTKGHNATRQQLGSFKDGSKSSVPSKELTKTHSQSDNGIKSGKQSSSSANDSNNPSCKAGSPLPTPPPPSEANDRSESGAQTLSPPSLIDRHEDEPEGGKRYVNSSSNIIINNNNNCNNYSSSNVGNRLASASPSSNAARSQSSSPSAAVTIGHDSGFQSINHDFNPRISSPNADARKIASARLPIAATVAAAVTVDGPREAGAASCETATVAKKQVAPSACPKQSNRSSTPIQVATQDAARHPDLESLNATAPGTAVADDATTAASLPTKTNRRHPEETPTKQIEQTRLAPIADADVAAGESTRGLSSGHADRQDGAQQKQTTANTKSTSTAAASSSSRLASSTSMPHASNSTGRLAATDSISRVATTAASGEPKESFDACQNQERSSGSSRPARPESDTIDGGATKSENSHSPPTKSRNFVRNSLPSRSVNFGHSKSSAYLDRIRASVTATTTTTNTTSSFNGQTRNIVLSTAQQPGSNQSMQKVANGHHQVESNIDGHHQQQQQHYELNCMLDHRHGERCFVNKANHAAGHPHTSASQQPVSVSHDGRHIIHAIDRPALQSSRQLNALIDPVSNEQLMMSLLHHQNPAAASMAAMQQRLYPQAVHPATAGQVGAAYAPLEMGAGDHLTEQQISRLTSLHHQHYYHHLQHMHQLHQLHHQHHMHAHHHKMRHIFQQQQQQQQHHHHQQSAAPGKQPVARPQQDSSSPSPSPSVNQAQRRVCEPIYSGGSQFYAPSTQPFDQIYGSMTANNNNNHNNTVNQLDEYHRTRLVANGSVVGTTSSNGNKSQIQSPDSVGLRLSPNNNSCRQGARTLGPHKVQHHHHQTPATSHYATLPQIDEVNGLPIVGDTIAAAAPQQQQQRGSPIRQHRSAQVVMTSEAIAKAKQQQQQQQQQHNSSSNGSPSSSSSSPTSPTSSSNLSPSSASSSSSSLNSLSASSAAPLNRSALRHTTTELTRRQFSIERELSAGALPMTATLSRVGSCRVNRSAAVAAQSVVCNHRNIIMNNNNSGHGGSSSPQQPVKEDATQMQTPVKTQQPYMRTSKILNISQQSTDLQSPTASQQKQQQQQQHHHHHQQQLYQQLSNQLGSSNRRPASNATKADGTCSHHHPAGGVDNLASNLANIRLNDKLAFTSLRAPKSSSGTSIATGSLNRSLTNNGPGSKGPKQAINTKAAVASHSIVATSSSSEKHKLLADNKQPPAPDGSGGGKSSSVWFEYGCV